jgi:hypothetical protein
MCEYFCINGHFFFHYIFTNPNDNKTEKKKKICLIL